ncbi:MAG: hypothetical protein E1N59_2983 [Puniceicoccaceae bacterium 5H]|nr:MAG: hypothetical protein E1N59_2983 [Puniceicoccaceae bacterium 5H]
MDNRNMDKEMTTIPTSSSGAWYIVRIPQGWHVWTVRLDEVDDEEETGHYTMWPEVAVFLGRAWSAELGKPSTLLRRQLMDHPHGFPRGRVVVSSGAATIFSGLEPQVDALRPFIESAFGVTGHARWQWDDHERVISEDKRAVQGILGLAEDWPSVDAEELFS